MLPITRAGEDCHYEDFGHDRSGDVTQADDKTSYPCFIYEPRLKVDENEKEYDGR